MTRFSSILLVGCGNMAGAMLQGWLAGGIAPETFTIVDPNRASAPDGVTLLTELPESGSFDAVMLGIKPQGLDDAAPAIRKLVGPDTVLFSILAGVEIASLAKRFPDAGAVLRIMPNLAVAIGKSPVALGEQGLDAAGREAVTALIEHLGTPEWLEDESLFDAVTAIAGCGPAFVYRFIDALAAGGVAQGIDPDQAERLAIAMVEGAAQLAASSSDRPGALADKVASPGGSTRAGMNVLDEAGAITDLMARTVKAARDRNAELAAAARGE